MKKIYCFIVLVLSFIVFAFSNNSSVLAKSLVANKTTTDIFGVTLGTIQIYDNGEIIIGYKYGLRKVNLYYCTKGDSCDNNFYSVINVME